MQYAAGKVLPFARDSQLGWSSSVSVSSKEATGKHVAGVWRCVETNVMDAHGPFLAMKQQAG